MKQIGLVAVALAVVLFVAAGVHADETADAVAGHIRSLEEGTGREKREALKALGEIGHDARVAVPAILAILEGEDEGPRAVATWALALVGATVEQALPALTKALADDDEDLRQAAVAAISGLEGSPKLTTAALALALADEAEKVRWLAAALLSAPGVDREVAAPGLLRCFETSTGRSRIQAGRALWMLGDLPPEFFPRLVRLLDDDDPEVRDICLLALEVHNGRWDSGVSSAGNLLKSASPRMQVAGAWLLARWKQRVDEALHVALRLAKTEVDEPAVQQRAVLTLGHLPDDPGGERLKAIVRALQDRDAGVRGAAATSLSLATDLTNEAAALLLEATRAADVDVQIAAARALGVHGRHVEVAVTTLMGLLDPEDLLQFGRAALALEDIGPAARAAVPALQGLASHKRKAVRSIATHALKAIRADEE